MYLHISKFNLMPIFRLQILKSWKKKSENALFGLKKRVHYILTEGNGKAEQFLEGDPLRYMLYASMPMMKCFLLNYLVILIGVFDAAIVLAYLYMCLKLVDAHIFLNYLVTSSMILFGLTTTCCRLLANKDINILFKLLANNYWFSKGRAKQEISRDVKFLKCYYFLAMVFGVMATVQCFIFGPSSIHFFHYILGIYFPKYSNLMLFMYRISAIMLMIYSADTLNMFIYFSVHAKFQIYVIFDYYDTLTENISDQLPNNEKYQKLLTKRLIKYIKRCQMIQRFGVLARNIIRKMFLPVAFSSTGIIFACICDFLYNLSTFESKIPMLIMVTCIVCCGSLYFYYGQSIENSTDHCTFHLTDTAWYYWNQKNKKILLIQMILANQCFKLSLSDGLSVNYNFALRFFRTLYSFVTALVKIRHRR